MKLIAPIRNSFHGCSSRIENKIAIPRDACATLVTNDMRREKSKRSKYGRNVTKNRP